MPAIRESERPGAIARAKALPIRKPYVAKFDPERLRDEKLMAIALDMTMRSWRDEAGEPMTNVRLAAFIGCAEVIVRGLRKRERVLQVRQVLKMPTDFRESLMATYESFVVPEMLRACEAANDSDVG